MTSHLAGMRKWVLTTLLAAVAAALAAVVTPELAQFSVQVGWRG
jgi:hypothetical protein